MESMIRKIVQEEVRKCVNDNEPTSSQTTASLASSSSMSTSSSHKTENRLSSLLTKIRKGRKEKLKEIKIQFRLQQSIDDEVIIVKPTNGGGSRFISLSKDEDPDFEEISKKAFEMYFPDGNKLLATLSCAIYDYNQNKVSDIDRVRQYLQDKGLYASRTWFFLRTFQADKTTNQFHEAQENIPETIDWRL